MKLCRCPICHSDLHLEALIEDEAGRELLGAIANLSHGCAKPMVNYLGLWKPAKSNLNNARALKIMNEVLERYPCSLLLQHSLTETVEAVRKKRREGRNHEPLANHNYLKAVYESQKINFAHISTAKKTLSEEEKAEQERLQKRKNNVDFIKSLLDRGLEDEAKKMPFYHQYVEEMERQNGTRT